MIPQLSTSAISDLKSAKAYLSIHSLNAREVIDRIFQRIRRIGEMPFLGAVVPEYGQESLREVFEAPYRIIYRVRETQIDIVAIVHSSRKLPRTLPM